MQLVINEFWLSQPMPCQPTKRSNKTLRCPCTYQHARFSCAICVLLSIMPSLNSFLGLLFVGVSPFFFPWLLLFFYSRLSPC